MLLTVITLIIFGFSVTASFADEYEAELNSMYEHNQVMVGLNLNSELNPDQMTEIKKYNSNNDPMMVVQQPINLRDYVGSRLTDYDWWYPYGKYEEIGLQGINFLVKLDSVSGETDANLRPDSRFEDISLCKLPQFDDEIAITDLLADMFIRNGYEEINNDVITKITKPDDLIGKDIDGLKITGIYSTELNIEDYKEYDGNFNHSDHFIDGFVHSAGHAIISYGFVCENFNSVFDISNKVLLKLSGDRVKDKTLLTTLKKMANNDNNYTPQLFSAYSSFVTDAFSYKYYLFHGAMILDGIFSLFSALLMMNYLTVSISFKKKEIGILRALGARRKDVVAICMSESMLIATTNFIISLVGVLIVCSIVNYFYYLPIFVIGIVPITLLFITCYGITALSTILPVRRITKKEPIEIIKDLK